MQDTFAIVLATRSDHMRNLALGAIGCVRVHHRRSVLIEDMDQLEDLRLPLAGVLTWVGSEELATRCRGLGKPVVNLSGRLAEVPFPSVLADHVAAGRQAGAYLLDQGHRAVAYAGLSEVNYARQRYEGIRGALAERGLEPRLLETPPRMEWVDEPQRRETVERWREALDPPVAIFCADDHIGRSVIEWSIEAGLSVPGEVSVLGATNDELACERSQPPLSSVDISSQEIGYRGAELLMRLAAGEQPPDEPVLVPPRGVVVRESSEVLAIRDPRIAEVLGFIRAHPGEAISVEQLTQRFALSRSALYRGFHDLLGRSPAKEIMRVRIQHAKTLLAASDQPLKHVAAKSGFASFQRMSQVFRRELNITPGEYRRQFRVRRGLVVR